jgi:hypothetical protein
MSAAHAAHAIASPLGAPHRRQSWARARATAARILAPILDVREPII